MKIPTYISREQQRGIPNVTVSNNAPIEAFGGGAANSSGAGMQRVGAALGELQETIFAEVVRERAEVLELDLMREVQSFATDDAAWRDSFQQDFQGEAARNGETEYAAFAKGQTAPLLAKYKGNASATTFLESRLGTITQSGLNSVRG